MTTDENAQRIVDEYPHLIQPDEHNLKMAQFWLMRDEIADAINANDDLLAFYAPPTDTMGYARQANTNLLVELGRGDGICLPSMYGEALEDNDE